MIDPRRGGRRGLPPGRANRVLGVLVGRLGLPVRGVWMLEVPDRRTGLPRRVPVIPVTVGGRRHLVAPRGVTGWVRDAEAAGGVRLVRGRRWAPYRAERLTPEDAVPVIAVYHRRNRRLVGRFFALPAEPTAAEIARVADRHPVFALIPA